MVTMRLLRTMAGTMLLLAVCGGRVGAADCSWGQVQNAKEAWRRLDVLRVKGCLIAPACDFALCRKVAALDSTSSAEGISGMIAEIRDSVEAELPSDYLGRSAMIARLEKWQALVRGPDPSHLPVAEWNVRSRGLFLGEPDSIVFLHTIESRMTELNSDAASELVLAATQMRLALLMEGTLHQLMAKTREISLALMQSYGRRWDAYFSDARASYPWERLLTDLFINGEPAVDGFEAPGHTQILALHPDAAYQYATFGADRLSESLVLELLGVYRWDWSADDKVEPRLSGSAFVGWQGMTHDQPYWGLMAHLPKGGSLGVGVRSWKRRAEWGVFAAGDAGKLFLRNSDARSEKVREYLIQAAGLAP